LSIVALIAFDSSTLGSNVTPLSMLGPLPLLANESYEPWERQRAFFGSIDVQITCVKLSRAISLELVQVASTRRRPTLRGATTVIQLLRFFLVHGLRCAHLLGILWLHVGGPWC
jgi:hypothetical protein